MPKGVRQLMNLDEWGGQTMTARTEFPAVYSAMVLKAWNDPNFLVTLKQDPQAALAAAGIQAPAGSTVNIIFRNLDRTAKLADQLALWEEGIKTGVYDIIIPIKPDDKEPLAA